MSLRHTANAIYTENRVAAVESDSNYPGDADSAATRAAFREATNQVRVLARLVLDQKLRERVERAQVEMTTPTAMRNVPLHTADPTFKKGVTAVVEVELATAEAIRAMYLDGAVTKPTAVEPPT